MAVTPTISIVRGDDFDLILTLKDSDGGAIDLTNATVCFTVKQKVSNTDSSVISKEVTEHTTPLEGLTKVSLSSGETAVDPGYYFYDVRIKTQAGKISSVQYGKFRIVQSITDLC